MSGSKKLTDLTGDELNLLDENQANQSKNANAPSPYPDTEEKEQVQRIIHSRVIQQIENMRNGSSYNTLPDYSPGQTVDNHTITADDLSYYRLTRPQIFATDQQRAETVLRLQNQIVQNPTPQAPVQENVYQLLETMSQYRGSIFPSIEDLYPTHNVDTGSEVMKFELHKNTDDDSPVIEFSKQNITSVMDIGLPGDDRLGSVIYHGGDFYLQIGLSRFKKPISGLTDYEKELDSESGWNSSGSEALWYEQETDELYEEGYDNTCRVCVDAGSDFNYGDMEKPWRKGAEIILRHYGKDFTQENIDKILSRDNGTKTNHLIMAIAYHQPTSGQNQNVRVLVMSYIPSIKKLEDYDEDENLEHIVASRRNFRIFENAMEELESRRKDIEKYDGKIAIYDTDQLKGKLASLKQRLETYYNDKNLNRTSEIVLFINPDDKKLKKIKVYKGRYRETGSQASQQTNSKNLIHDKEKDSRESIISQFQNDARMFFLLTRTHSRKKYVPSKSSSLESWFEQKIGFPRVNLVPNTQDNSKNNKSKKQPQAFGPKVKPNKKVLKKEENKAANNDEKSEIVEDTKKKKEPNWFERSFLNFEKTGKEIKDHYSSQDKIFNSLLTKQDFRRIMMQAIKCLLEGQTGQSIRAIQNDVNVLANQYKEYKKWNKGKNMFSSEGKNLAEHIEAVPTWFYPDDFPVDDMSLAFMKSLRESISLIVKTLVSSLVQSALDSIINFCLRPDPMLPLPGERTPIPDFNFDRLGDLIDALYDDLITPDELSDLFDGLSDRFTALEICSLLEGEPSPDVLRRAFEYIRELCIDWMDTKDKVRDFFASIGESLGDTLEICDQIRALADNEPLGDDFLCPPDMGILRGRLRRRGLTEEQIERQIAEEQARKKKLAEDLLSALNDGIMSGDFVVPSVFCQKNEDGTVQQGTVSFFDDQFKYVAKETMENMFASTYNNFKKSGGTLKDSYMMDVFQLARVPKYRRRRALDPDSGQPIDEDMYPMDVIIEDLGNDDESQLVRSKYAEILVKKPIPYFVNFYKDPAIDVYTDIRGIEKAEMKFPHDFTSQLENMADKVSTLRNYLVNRSSSDRDSSGCEDEDERENEELQNLIDRVSQGVSANVRSIKLSFEEIYDSRSFINSDIDCFQLGEGAIKNPFTGQCECAEGFVKNPNQGSMLEDGTTDHRLCVRVESRSRTSDNIPQRSEERCEPAPPSAVSENPYRTEPLAQSAVTPQEEPAPQHPEVQYNVRLLGNEDFPDRNFYYNKMVPNDVIFYLREKNQEDKYDSFNVFYQIMKDNIHSMTVDSEQTERAMSIIFPQDNNFKSQKSLFYDIKKAMIREVMDLVISESTSPYLKPREIFQGEDLPPKKRYPLEYLNLGPELINPGVDGLTCDPHLLQIRQVLEEMFDELGDNMCLDIHSSENLDEDGIPRLKPLEKAAMSACIKVTLRHYLIENITRGLLSHATFDKVNLEMSDMKLNFIIGKMKLAMEAYSENYFNNFSKYALAVYDGPKPEDASLRSKKKVLVDMLRKQYSKISYNLREALLLGPNSEARNVDFFSKMFSEVTGGFNSNREIVIYKEIINEGTRAGSINSSLTAAPDNIDPATQARFEEFREEVFEEVSRADRAARFASDGLLMNQMGGINNSDYQAAYRCPLRPDQFTYFHARLSGNVLDFTGELIPEGEGLIHDLAPHPRLIQSRIIFAVEKTPTGARLIAIVPEDFNFGQYKETILSLQQGLSTVTKRNGIKENEFKRVIFTKHFDNRFIDFSQNTITDEHIHLRSRQAQEVAAWTIPIFDFKEKNLTIDAPRKENLIDLWTGQVILDASSNNFDRIRDEFYNAMNQDRKTKMLFNYCFPVKEYATMVNIHEMETNLKNINMVANFGETRDSLYGVFYAVQPMVNDWQKQPKALEDLASSLGLPALFPGQLGQMMDKNAQLLDIACTKYKYNFGLNVCWGNPFLGLGFSSIIKMAAIASAKILKDWIEKNDPNIKLAKKLSFLTQLACIDISTSATSGLIHSAFPYMSTQFTALYNALGLGDLDGGLESDSEEGEKQKKHIEEAGLSLPNYCGYGGLPAGDANLDAAAERGEKIERLYQIRLNEQNLRDELQQLENEYRTLTAEITIIREEIKRIDIRESYKSDDSLVGNPFSGIEYQSTSTGEGEDEIRGHSIVARERENEYRGQSIQSLRRQRDRIKDRLKALEPRIVEIQEDLQFLEENS